MSRVTELVFLITMLFLFVHVVAGDTADDLIEKGRSYQSAGRYEEALGLFDQAIIQKPGESYVYLPKHDILDKLSRYDERDVVWDTVMDKLPNSTEPIYYYAFVPGGSMMCAGYHSTGKEYIIFHQDYEQALFYFKRVHELCPNDTDIANVYQDEGYALYKLGRYNESLKAYQTALEIAEKTLASNPKREAYITNNEIAKYNTQIIANKMNPTRVVADQAQPSLEDTSTRTQEIQEEDVTMSTETPHGTPLPWFISILAVCIGVFILNRRI